jgi:hypothetical protein
LLADFLDKGFGARKSLYPLLAKIKHLINREKEYFD